MHGMHESHLRILHWCCLGTHGTVVLCAACNVTIPTRNGHVLGLAVFISQHFALQHRTTWDVRFISPDGSESTSLSFQYGVSLSSSLLRRLSTITSFLLSPWRLANEQSAFVPPAPALSHVRVPSATSSSALFPTGNSWCVKQFVHHPIALPTVNNSLWLDGSRLNLIKGRGTLNVA